MPGAISGSLKQNKETCSVRFGAQAQDLHELSHLRDLFGWSRIDLIAHHDQLGIVDISACRNYASLCTPPKFNLDTAKITSRIATETAQCKARKM